VFLYANTEEAGREAERVVRAELEREGWDAQIALDRWHPVEERWEDAALPLPETDQERDAEHAAALGEMVATLRPGGGLAIDFLNAAAGRKANDPPRAPRRNGSPRRRRA